VRYQADPTTAPKPPRQPWRAYLKRNAKVKTPPGGWQAWNKNLLAITDRAGHRAFEHIPDGQSATAIGSRERIDEASVSAALLPIIAPDSALCTHSHLTYEVITNKRQMTHFALNGGQRSSLTPKTHHINTVNSLISRYREFAKPFRGEPSAPLVRAPGERDQVSFRLWVMARRTREHRARPHPCF
jgi:hypothetical protein